MARQPAMPKAVSSLQSVQRSYISENEESKHSKREEKGFGEQNSAEELVIGRVRRDSAVIVCNCTFKFKY
jgi:hypothetical protein